MPSSPRLAVCPTAPGASHSRVPTTSLSWSTWRLGQPDRHHERLRRRQATISGHEFHRAQVTALDAEAFSYALIQEIKTAIQRPQLGRNGNGRRLLLIPTLT